MSASSFNEHKGKVSSHQLTDEKMEQVRDILFGDHERQMEARVRALENHVEQMEVSLNSRLDALQARLDAMSAKMDATQTHTLNEIGFGLRQLAECVANINSNFAEDGQHLNTREPNDAD